MGCMGGDGPDYGAAAAAQTAALEKMAQVYREMYNTTRGDLMPGITAYGRTVPYIGGLLGIPGYHKVDPTKTLRATPGYQFALNQGADTLGRYAAARGMSMSGPQMKALQTYGQGMADQTYQQYLGNLFGVSNAGQNAAAQTGQFGMQAAGGIGSAYAQQGQAQANAILAEGLQRQSGYGSLMGGLGMLGGLIAAPFTGGTSLLGAGLSGLGGLLGGGGGGYNNALFSGGTSGMGYGNLYGYGGWG